MTPTDQSMLFMIIMLTSGLVTAWISSLIAVVGQSERQTNQFSDNIVGFLLGCVLSGLGIIGWFLLLR